MCTCTSQINWDSSGVTYFLKTWSLMGSGAWQLGYTRLTGQTPRDQSSFSISPEWGSHLDILVTWRTLLLTQPSPQPWTFSLQCALGWSWIQNTSKAPASQVKYQPLLCPHPISLSLCFSRQSFSVWTWMPWTHYIDQASLELRDPPASASWVLGLKACTTMAQSVSLQTLNYSDK